jgi:hypothetical protein
VRQGIQGRGFSGAEIKPFTTEITEEHGENNVFTTDFH